MNTTEAQTRKKLIGSPHLLARQREALRQADHLFQTLLHQAFTER
jgi:hypothetical protein